jgi:diguanylate cyclase (GGDEF)-like protein
MAPARVLNLVWLGHSVSALWRFLRKPSSLPAIIALGVLALAAGFADFQNTVLFQQSERAKVQDGLSVIRAKLEGNINGNIRLVQGLVATLSTEPGMQQDRFSQLADNLFDKGSQLRNVAGARNLVVNLMYPMEGNERAVGLDYNTNEAQREAALRARQTKQVVFAGPVDLLQGGQGFIGRFPVFIGESAAKDFWGIISAVIDVERLYTDSGLLDPDLPISVAIVGQDGLGEGGKQFFGPEAIIADHPVTASVALPSGSWQLYAAPKDGWVETPPSALGLRLIMLVLAGLVVVPIFISARLAEERQAHIKALGASADELQRLSRRLGMALQTSKIGVWENDLATGNLYWDNRVNEIFGLPQDGGKRHYKDWRAALHPDDLARAEAEFKEAIDVTGQYYSDYRIITTSGDVRNIRAIGTVYKDPGTTEKIVGVNWDVTADVALNDSLKDANRLTEARNVALAEAKADIEHNALHDSLTGLPNRRYLDDMLQRHAMRCALDGRTLALLHIDLDRFKQINDTLGHAAGDAMLVHASYVLNSNIRPDDFVARIGGDEFVVVCVTDGDEAVLADLANRIIVRMRQPVNYEGHECRFGVSVGIATASGQTVDPRKLLVNADIALYKAKSRGRNRFEFFSESLQAEVIKTKRVADQILRGLDRGEFEPWFQPQFDSRTLDVIGCEALARWRHPTEGILTPDAFMSVAEELNVVATIDRIVLEQSLKYLDQWEAVGCKVPRVSVNVSSRRLQDEGLVASLRDLKIKPGTVSFELVESIFLDESDDMVLWHIDQIKDLGIDIEIDDFGTGYASIVSLLKLKPRRLKIDRQLVTPVVNSVAQRHLVESVIEIGKALDIDVVGEGVETMEHARILRDLGCEILQGYAFARPMPASEMVDFIRAESWRNVAEPLRANRGVVVKRQA